MHCPLLVLLLLLCRHAVKQLWSDAPHRCKEGSSCQGLKVSTCSNDRQAGAEAARSQLRDWLLLHTQRATAHHVSRWTRPHSQQVRPSALLPTHRGDHPPLLPTHPAATTKAAPDVNTHHNQ